LKAEHKVVSNASAPPPPGACGKVPNDLVGIKSGFMTTIHAYTNDQNVLDQAHKDIRRSAVASNMILTDGAATAVGWCCRSQRRLDARPSACRRPTCPWWISNSFLAVEITVEEINKAMHASKQQFGGISA
jgi:glyceraldehyde 3-phosphate dehydrogenase